MANYIDKREFHDEMVKCKKSGILSNRAVGYFQLMANEISRTYYYNQPEDRDDAKARAVQDCFKYWKGFKESNVAQVQFTQNFKDRDKIIINILNHKTFIFVAAESAPKKANEFQISDTINRSLKSLIAVINLNSDVMEGFLDTINRKLTVMDKYNQEDLSIKSKVQVVAQEQIIEIKNKDKENPNILEFKNPPDAFCYYTSTIRNGILKIFNELYPEVHKAANRVSMSSLHDHQQRLYNI